MRINNKKCSLLSRIFTPILSEWSFIHPGEMMRALKWFKLISQNFFENVFLKRKLFQFYLMFGGHIYFQTLSAAVQFDLFSRLREKQEGLSQKQIADLLNIEAQPCRILLLGLVSLGLLKKKGELYENRLISKIYLSRQSPKNIIDIVKWQHFINYKPMYHFFESLVQNKNLGLGEIAGTEPTLYERLGHDPFREQIFQDAMAQISAQANDLFTEFIHLKGIKHLVDVGGGHGSNIIKLTQKYPTLKASVFDLPTITQEAHSIFSRHPNGNRLSTFDGDCFKDPFPKGPDCFLFCHFFTIWSLEKNLQLLKKAYDALPEGGRVIVFNMMQNDKQNGPMGASLGSPYFLTLATGEGMLYTWHEYEDIFKRAGFSALKTIKLPMQHGAIVGIKEKSAKKRPDFTKSQPSHQTSAIPNERHSLFTTLLSYLVFHDHPSKMAAVLDRAMPPQEIKKDE